MFLKLICAFNNFPVDLTFIAMGWSNSFWDPKIFKSFNCKFWIIKDSLEIKNIKLRDLNILGNKEDFKNLINIKVRSTGKLLKAKIKFTEKDATVEILDNETGISPGQACVFYSKNNLGDKVLGGGWIHKTFNKNIL